MSSPRRREERRQEFEAQLEAERAERLRVLGLSIYQRIEEIESVHDVKEFLHMLCDRLDVS